MKRKFADGILEMMDRPDANHAVLEDDLRNLRTINRHFGGLSALRNAALPLGLKKNSGDMITILDLATGSGDQPLSLVSAFLRAGRKVRITAVDRNEIMLQTARSYVGDMEEIQFERRDILDLPYADASFDLVTCSLAIHHFTRGEGIKILREMNRLSSVGFVVNDLSRSLSGAVSAWVYSRVTTRNPMTRYDSVLSVLRAYRKDELDAMASEAGIQPVRIFHAPLFRLVVVKEK